MSQDQERVEIVKKNINYSNVVWALRYCYFAYYFSVGCIQTFYPILLKKIHIHNSQIGIMTSIGLVGGTVSPIIVGILADKLKSSRKILMLLSLFTFVFHTIPIFIITIKIHSMLKDNHHAQITPETFSSYFVYFLYLCQFFITFGDQGAKALMDGLNHKVLTRARSFGVIVDFSRLRMFGGAGMALTAAISGIALEFVRKQYPSFPEEYTLISICLVFGTTYVIMLATFVPDAETEENVSFLDAFNDIRQRMDVIICYITQFMLQFATNITKSFDTLYISHLGGNKMVTGLATCCGYLVDLSMMYFSPIITGAVGGKELTIVASSFVSAGRTFFYAFADNYLMSFNNNVLAGFSVGLTIPTMSTLVKSKAPEKLISSYVSLLTGCGKIGASVATAIGGYVSGNCGYSFIYIISSVVFALAASTLLFYYSCFSKSSTSKTCSKIGMKDDLKELNPLLSHAEENVVHITTDVDKVQ